MIDDLRAALAWAGAPGAPADRRATAAELATLLAVLAYRRGRASESQHRYEESAALAEDGAVAGDMLHRAAEVASNRQAGDDAFRLHQEAAEAALQGGDHISAARYFAYAATFPNRCPGIMVELPPAGTDRRLLDRAQALGVGHPEVEAALLVADAFTCEDGEPLAEVLAARAVVLARRDGDALIESAALDVLTANQLAMGELAAAAESARLRTVLLAPMPMTPEASFERVDAYQMAAQTALGVGDIPGSRRFSLDLVRSTTIREAPHLGLARLLLVDALAGDWGAIDDLGATWLKSWEAAGRPVVSSLAGAARAMALVGGIRGDEEAHAHWCGVATVLRSVIDQTPGASDVLGPYVEGLVQLHRGRPADAVAVLVDPPDLFRYWYNGVWRHLYAAAWAEAAVLAGRPDTADRLARARLVVDPADPVSSALLDRVEALAAGDRPGLLAAAAALEAAGSHYQAARSLVLAGGDEATPGREALAALGATPSAPAAAFRA